VQWLDIQPGLEIGPVRFGMSPDEVAASFQEPLDDSNWRGGNLNDSLLYLDLQFAFNKCDLYGPTPDGRLNFIVVQPRQDVRCLAVC
jgi:hypothetical protein